MIDNGIFTTRTTTTHTIAALALSALVTGCPDVAAEPDCPDLSGRPGTLHAAETLSADATWRAEDAPHRVEGTVTVRDGATLTVEACAEVRMAEGAALRVGDPYHQTDGQLVTQGEAERRVTFTGTGWAGLLVFAPGTARLSHTDILGGGAATDFPQATVVVLGTGERPLSRSLEVHDVRIRDAGASGLWMSGGARFVAGSDGLVVTGSGTADAHFPLVLGSHAAQDTPDGAYTGNRIDEVLLVEDGLNSSIGLQVDTTLRDLGVPYRVGRFADENLRIGANGGPPATLTIEAGVQLRFSAGTGLRVVSDAEAPRGRLVVQGRPGREVVFTSAASPANKGDWSGLYFESPMAAHAVRAARIEYAGGNCSCTLASCSPVDTYDAAVVLDGEPQGAFMTESSILHSAGHGFARSWLDRADLDFLADNEVDDVTGCKQTQPMRSNEVCPDPAYACGQ